MSQRHEDYRHDGRNGWHAADCRPGDTASRFRDYLRGLTTEHWLIFIAGLLIGMIIG